MIKSWSVNKLIISNNITSITNMQRLNGIAQIDCDFEYLFR